MGTRPPLIGRRVSLGAALAVALSGQACVWAIPLETTPSTDSSIYVVGWSQTGIASWYGEPFHGQPTASGTIYDMDGMTAAHQTVPLGTRIRVDNLENGRSIELLVNDRGPFVRGRILDVTRAAARDLGMMGPGTARVRITVIEAANTVSARGGCVLVQVASYRERGSAEVKLEEVVRAGFDASIETYEDVHRVVAGPFAEEAAARRAQEALGGFQRRC